MLAIGDDDRDPALAHLLDERPAALLDVERGEADRIDGTGPAIGQVLQDRDVVRDDDVARAPSGISSPARWSG